MLGVFSSKGSVNKGTAMRKSLLGVGVVLLACVALLPLYAQQAGGAPTATPPASVTKWEYAIDTVDMRTMDTANARGRDGWEQVAVYGDPGDRNHFGRMYFKRPIR